MRLPAALLVLGMAAGCFSDDPEPREVSAPTQSPTVVTPVAQSSPSSAPTPTPAPPRRYDAAAALETVRHLAGVIGPRHGTSAAFRALRERAAKLDARVDERREQYNAAVGMLNFRCQAFPYNLVARTMGMQPAPFLS